MTIYINPARDEALSLTTTHLLRWNLNDLETPLVQAEYWLGWRPPLAVAADGDTIALPILERLGPSDACVVEMRRWDDFGLVAHVRIPDSGAGLTALVYAPDGRWLAAADLDENVYLLEATTGAVASVVYGGGFTSALTFSSDGATLAALSAAQGGGSVGVWQVDAHGLREPALTMDRSGLRWHITDDGNDGGLDMAEARGTLASSSDARLLVACVESEWCPWPGEIAVYEVATGHPLWRTPLHARPKGGRLGSMALFTADGAGLVYGSATGEVTILGVSDGTPRQSINVATGTDTSMLAADRLNRGVWATGRDGRPLLIMV